MPLEFFIQFIEIKTSIILGTNHLEKFMQLVSEWIML